MPSLEDAIALALTAHRGQVDHVNQPYILHPLRVMFRLEQELDRIVAVLHDVIEDTDLTLEDLRQKGYSNEILAALDGVTRREEESYEDFVERSLAHPISRRVKLADLEDNMDIRRLSTPLNETDFNRLRRYRRAWDRLKSGSPD